MVVDGEGFVGCVRGLRDALAGLPVVVGLLPSSRAAQGVVARGYDVFGQGRSGIWSRYPVRSRQGRAQRVRRRCVFLMG